MSELLTAHIPARFNGIAIITDCPSLDDVNSKQWFVDGAGRFLRGVMSRNQLSFENCYVNGLHGFPVEDANLVNVSPDIINTRWAEICADLTELKPTLIICFSQHVLARLAPDAPVKHHDYRGFTFPVYALPFRTKAICIHHPRLLLQMPKYSFGFRFDIAKAAANSNNALLLHPQFETEACLTADRAVARLDELIYDNTVTRVAFDIEGYANSAGIRSISFCAKRNKSFALPFVNAGGTSYWPVETEATLWHKVAQLLTKPGVTRIMHNMAYELFVLQWRHGIVVGRPVLDTYLLWHEQYVEAEKSLSYVASLLLDYPYWKDDRGAEDINTLLRYNCIDTCATLALADKLESHPDANNAHNRRVHKAALGYMYMSLRGVLFDKNKAEQILAQKEAELAPLMRELFISCGREINPKSVPDKKWLLYEHLKLRPDHRLGDTTKELALLKHWDRTKNPVLRLLIRAINKRTEISDIKKLVTSRDGRIRCSYNAAGTLTWRANSEASQDHIIIPPKTARGSVKEEQTGTNLQNVSKEFRACFIADPNYWFWQCDLEGADSWTVAADLAALGYTNMLDDLLAGMKPAKVLLLMLNKLREGGNPNDINTLPRDEIKRLCKLLDTNNAQADDYLCMKRIVHGTNYMMKETLCSDVIFKDTGGELYLPPHEALKYQNLYRLRYNAQARIELISGRLRQHGYIKTAAGTVRRCYATRGSYTEHELLASVVSNEPQTNTTEVINNALINFLFDSRNRRSNGALFVEPLVQVHDALAGQFPQRLTDWARELIHTYYKNELIVSGVKISIPFEGHYGPDWKEQPYDI